ncbi:MAG: hypothetical protein GX422_05020 [Deltaproteobacteria bacterium]|jgi:uncharacterized protein (DUF362 family)|nr:hypothetical protein [Deltaproteobacteria bacterium]
MPGIDVFVDGGPMRGKRAKGNVFLAWTDRTAISATGVAILKALGSNPTVMNRKIFEQEQIARAVELGLGVSSPVEIKLFPVNEESAEYCSTVRERLIEG